MDELFRLDEYREAAAKFVTSAIDALMDAHDPFLAQIPRRTAPTAAPQRLALTEGRTTELELFTVESVVTIQFDTVIAGRFDEFYAMLNEAGTSPFA